MHFLDFRTPAHELITEVSGDYDCVRIWHGLFRLCRESMLQVISGERCALYLFALPRTHPLMQKLTAYRQGRNEMFNSRVRNVLVERCTGHPLEHKHDAASLGRSQTTLHMGVYCFLERPILSQTTR
jgi:hypothetical protein